ncbi:MAG TPA: prepilin-type N-terminal cleavage/methylation domain-containing protein [Thermoanaerobaculia bacterium]|jgi:prepilin-type N-terminal cleavage/methylation domain-containing protein|nr:prepilin-type N-terminal cleavage/methylation domain-containing protein [Thermoanaerobaculia bacterium]
MRLPLPPRRSGRESGFSLVEVLIALVLVGTALLMGMGLALQQPRIVRRLDGERQAFRAMEATLEAVRAGVVPLRTAELGGFVTAVGTPAPKNLQIQMQVDPEGTPGLFQVTLLARYEVEHRKVEKTLRTLVWSPP